VSAVNRTITARAVEARLSLSKTMLDFGSQIVLRSNQVKPPYSLDVLLTSNEEGDIAWQMGLPSCEGLEGCGGVFAMEPNSGTLAKVGMSDLLRSGSTHAWLIIVIRYRNTGQPPEQEAVAESFITWDHCCWPHYAITWDHCKLSTIKATSIIHLNGVLRINFCIFLALSRLRWPATIGHGCESSV
jgi:hypothetical protein